MTKYETPQAYRSALEARIKSESSGEDITYHRKRAAFAAFLKRISLSGHEFALKGGHAMMLRFDVKARPSKDMDFVMQAQRKAGDKIQDPVLQVAIALEEIAGTTAPDFFSFDVKGNPKTLVGAGYGSWRFKTEAKIDRRRFESFHIDVAYGDAWIDPMDIIQVKYFSLTDDPLFGVKTISSGQQFAEKLHAYTLDREANSRVKDLVDMVILIKAGLDKDTTKRAIDTVFKVRGTHRLPQKLTRPPKTWNGPFTAMANTCKLNVDLNGAFNIINEFVL